MAVGGGGVSALFFHGPITPGDVASWESEGVLIDGGGGGGGGMSIGGAVVGGTPGSVLFVGAGPTLAQDNTNFFWDDANLQMQIGRAGGAISAYFTNGARGLYTVPNASGNNWFEDNAGNTTLTGYANIGTGDRALFSLTTGHENMAVGFNALLSCDTGFQNTAVGVSSLQQLHSGSNNFGVGFHAGFNISSGQNNVAIGSAALNNITIEQNNVGIGTNALFSIGMIAPGFNAANLAIGSFAGSNITAGEYNTFIGEASGTNLAGVCSRNTWIGPWTGPVASVSNTIIFSRYTGGSGPNLDFNYTSANVWSYQDYFTPLSIGLHVYNVADASNAPPVNYERAVFDWNIVANVLVIGTQNGGTGSTRNLEFIIGGTNKLDFGVTNAGLWTFAQATMFATSVTLTNGAAAQIGTLTNGPAAGNPTKWIPINDNGTTRYIPAW